MASVVGCSCIAIAGCHKAVDPKNRLFLYCTIIYNKLMNMYQSPVVDLSRDLSFCLLVI